MGFRFRFFESGISQYWLSDICNVLDLNFVRDFAQNYKMMPYVPKRLTYTNVSGAFNLLFVGLVLAVIVFCFELIWNNITGSR